MVVSIFVGTGGVFCDTMVMAVGRAVASGNGRGKSGLHRAACRLTAGQAFGPDGKRNRKYTASPRGEVRVKWCGKSAPRRKQFRRHGKPHAEQDQIGEKGRPALIDSRVGR